MGILLELKSRKNSFTNTEQVLTDYIVEHTEEVVHMSIYQLAEKVKTSIPTITRLAQKLGYKGFRDFIIALASELTSENGNGGARNPESDFDLVDRLFSKNIKNLEDTKSLLDTDKLIALCNRIQKSKKTVFFGIGASNLVARYAALRINQIGIQAEAYDDAIMMLLNAKRLDEDCVAIGISHSGSTALVIKTLEIAKKNKATTAGLSNYLESPLSKVCDYLFCTAYPENRVSALTLSSHIAQLAIIDTMYLLLAKNITGNWDMEEIDSIIAGLLRV